MLPKALLIASRPPKFSMRSLNCGIACALEARFFISCAACSEVSLESVSERLIRIPDLGATAPSPVVSIEPPRKKRSLRGGIVPSSAVRAASSCALARSWASINSPLWRGVLTGAGLL